MRDQWAEYYQAHYDALPPKVREAVREHADNIDTATLRKVGKTPTGMLALLKNNPPTLNSAYEAAVARQTAP